MFFKKPKLSNVIDVYIYRDLEKRSHKHLPSRTFIRLFTLPYKSQFKAWE